MTYDDWNDEVDERLDNEMLEPTELVYRVRKRMFDSSISPEEAVRRQRVLMEGVE